MTFKIALSKMKALSFDFEKEVAAFVKAKQDHRKTVGESSPHAPHPWVEAAVTRVAGSIDPPKPDDFVADYEVVDDTPPPLTLDQRKQVLATDMQRQAQEAVDKIVPPLKNRLMNMELLRAHAIPEAERTPGHKATIAESQDRHVRMDAIHYHLARMEAQIHDLTEDTIEDFSPEPFPR